MQFFQKYRLVFICIVLALVAFAVFRPNLSQVLPYAVFLLCPLMHIFMMKDHGKHEEHQESDKEVPHHH